MIYCRVGEEFCDSLQAEISRSFPFNGDIMHMQTTVLRVCRGDMQINIANKGH